MQLKNLLKQLMLISVTLIVTLFLVTIFSIFYFPGHIYNFYNKLIPYSAGIPVRLKIPKINVDAKIISVGVAKDGSMEAPAGPRDVGWFKFGSRPGDVGSAVIDGHYGYWIDGEGSVFDDLNKLRKDDELYIQDSNNITVTFVVRKILTYDPNKDASSIFGSGDGAAHLNLITCEGVWDETSKTYSNRLVIFTDKKQ